MNIFTRIGNLLKAEMNEALDRAEDPEKMVKLMVLEMEEAVRDTSLAVADATAQERNLIAQVNKYSEMKDFWKQRAVQLLKGGSEDLAREALQKKAESEKIYIQYKERQNISGATTLQLRQELENLKERLNEVKLRQATLVARHKVIHTHSEFSRKFGNTTAFDKFDSYEERIRRAEDEATIFAELTGQTPYGSLEREFEEMRRKSQVDSEFEKLKEELLNKK